MASAAQAMLSSRDFGSSGSSDEDEEERQQHHPHDHEFNSINNDRAGTYDESINDTTDPTTGMSHGQGDDGSQSYIGQQTAADLASFEDSFVPQQPPPATSAISTRQRPKTPSAKEVSKQRRLVSDAAGFTTQDGPRDMFARDEGVIDLSLHQEHDRNSLRAASRQSGGSVRTKGRGGVRQAVDDGVGNADDDDEDESSGLKDQPSFERSESQSMRVDNVTNRRGGKTTNGTGIRESEYRIEQARPGPKQQLTLREQEKLIDEVKKENFSLKLKIYFLEDRLAKLAPEHVDAALKETIELKVEYQNVKQELKKHKKWLVEATDALDQSRKNQDLAHGRISRTEQEANAEIERLREELRLERQARDEDREHLQSQLGELEDIAGSRAADNEELQRAVDSLEDENGQLRSQVNAQVTMLATRNDEKEQLYDELEAIKQDNLALENELQEYKNNGGGSASDKEAALQDMEDELNNYRDKLSEAMLDLERKEKEVEELNAELDQKEADQEKDILNAIDEWKAALEEARQDKDQLTDALEDRDRELKTLDKKLEEFENLAQEDRQRLERALRKIDEKQKEVNMLGEEVMTLTDDLQKISKQLEETENEADDKAARLQELERDLDDADRELQDRQSLHDQVVKALKEKTASNKSRQADLTIQHESLTTEITFLRNKTEELAMKNAELEEGRRSQDKQGKKLEDEKVALERKLRQREGDLQQAQLDYKRDLAETENSWRNTVSEKDQIINSVRANLRQLQDRLEAREQDIDRLNQVLQNRDTETKKIGESHTSDRMSLILEVERLQRDAAHYEVDLDHARSELARRDEELRQRDMENATLRATNHDVSAQLALQTQTRLSLSEKLDAAAKTLRETQDDLAAAKDKLRRSDRDSGRSSRDGGKVAAEYREQLAERNILLQTLYQAIDKAIETDRSKPAQANLKPHSNFSVFHDAIMNRIRVLASIKQLFDKKAKDMEGRFAEQINNLKRQIDHRLRQLDRLELAMKNAADAQKQWKQRILLKHNEVESVKATNGELNEQLSSLKTRVSVSDMSPGSTHEIQSLRARASTAERRLKATQDQLQLVETKFEEGKAKVSTAEEQWQARLRELQQKLKEAEEKHKRERQGAKERVRELQQINTDLQQQVDSTHSRTRKLAHVLDNQVV